MKQRKDKYKELGCEFKNEDECEEDLDEERADLIEVEKNHFEENEE